MVGKTSFTFNYFHPSSNNLIYQGDAHVPSGASYLRLTKTDSSSGKPAQNSVGRVLYSPPVQFWEPGSQASFDTTIKFFITPPAEGDPADGIAFFIAPVNSAIPPRSTGGNFGIFDESGKGSSVFAIEFDTFVNSGWDPGYPHIGIDIKSRSSAAVTKFEDAFMKEVTAHIKYTPNTKRINVVVTTDSETFLVEHDFDLKTILPQKVQVGISGATGSSVATHDILSWAFTSAMVKDSISV